MSAHRQTWTLALLMGAALVIGATAPGQAQTPLMPGVSTAGTFSDGDWALQDLVLGRDGDLSPSDAFLFAGQEGQQVRLSVNASVPVLLVLLDPMLDTLAEAGSGGNSTAPSLRHTLDEAGAYTIVVSAIGGQTGDYSIRLTLDEEEPMVAAVSPEPVVPATAPEPVVEATPEPELPVAWPSEPVVEATPEPELPVAWPSEPVVEATPEPSAPVETQPEETWQALPEDRGGEPPAGVGVGEQPAAPTTPAAPLARRLGFGYTNRDAFAVGDATLEALMPEKAGHTYWSDAYVVEAPGGQELVVQVRADVGVYAALVTGDGRVVAETGGNGEAPLSARLTWVPPREQAVYVIVSTAEGFPGSYRITAQSNQ
jgi:hypothetical protein